MDDDLHGVRKRNFIARGLSAMITVSVSVEDRI